METPKKRKREPDALRVTYDAETRTFDRLFKENNLEEMRDVVRKKMTLPSTTNLRLYQVRDGKSIDLEDDDDFEAFAASRHISSTTTVRVVIGDEIVQTDPDAQTPQKVKRKKKKRGDKVQTDTVQESLAPKDTSTDAPPPAKKRRVSFAEALSSPPASPEQSVKKRQPSLVKPSPASLSTSTTPGAVASDTSQQQTSNANEEKKEKRKKKKKHPSPGIQPSQEPDENAASSPKPQSTPKSSEDPTTAIQQSKKRPRTDDSEHVNSIQELPSSDGQPEISGHEPQEPPPKKKKSKQKNATDDQALKGPNSSATVSRTSSSPADVTDSATQPKKEKRKKKKASEPPQESADPKTTEVELLVEPSAPQSAEIDASREPKKKRSKKKEKLSEPPQNAQLETPTPAEADTVDTNEKSKKRKSKSTDKAPDQTPSTPARAVDTLPVQGEPDIAAAKSLKKKKDKRETDVAETDGTPKPPTIDVKEATLAAVQTIMARYSGKKLATTSTAADTEAPGAQSQTNPLQISPMDPAEPQKVTQAATKPHAKEVPLPSASAADPSNEARTTLPLSAKIGAKNTAPEGKSGATISALRKAKPELCVYCDGPHHYRSKCKLVRNPRAGQLEARIQQLEALPVTGIEDNGRASIITELKQLVETRWGRPYEPSAAPKSTASPTTPAVSTHTASADATPPAAVNGVEEATIPAGSTSEDEAPFASASSPSKGPTKISTRKTSKESSQATPKPKPVQASKVAISLGATLSPFLDVRDISSYTEKDLEALIRGPPVSSKDVPSTETSEDEREEDEEDLVADEEEDADKSSKNRTRPNYASSDDEDQEEEDDNQQNADKVSAPLQPPTLVSESSGRDTSESSGGTSSPENFHEGNISFQEMEALGSSMENDRTGDVAFEKAYAQDVASISGNPLLTYDDESVASEKVVTDTSITAPRQESEESEDAIVEEPTSAQPIVPATVDEDDPIEEEEPEDSQEHGMQTLCASNAQDDSVSESQPVALEHTPVGRSARKKGALTPISELPVPPHPGMRVIKPLLVGSQTASKTPAKTPARGRQRVAVVAEEAQLEDTPSADPPIRVTRRSSRSVAAGSSVVATPGKRGAIAQLALEPEVEDDNEVPRTRPRTRMQLRATSAQPEATPTNPGSKASKPTSKAAGTKTPAKPPSKAPAASNKKKQVVEQALDLEVDASLGTQTECDTTMASWETLPETQGRDSQSMNDSHEMDELISSSNPFSGPSAGYNDDDDAGVDAGSSQNPLFLHSETQQSLPYSQYPDVTTKKGGSPNESDEEEEVEAVIQSSAPISAPRYRGLTELQGVKSFSKPTLRPARFNPKPVHDLYGRSGQESESSDGSDSSDSETEGNKIESHIPLSRRAGGPSTRRK